MRDTGKARCRCDPRESVSPVDKVLNRLKGIARYINVVMEIGTDYTSR